MAKGDERRSEKKHADPKVMSHPRQEERTKSPVKEKAGRVHCLPRKATLWSTQIVVVQDVAIYTAVEGEKGEMVCCDENSTCSDRVKHFIELSDNAPTSTLDCRRADPATEIVCNAEH